MSTFSEAIGPLLDHEGGHLVPQDNGRGASKWGITLLTYRELYADATAADIAELGPEQASAFYRRMFWERWSIGLLDDQSVANKVLDLVVNCGPTAGVRILQRAVGAPATGHLGHITAGLANQMEPARVLEGIRIAGAGYYRELVERRPEYSRFLDGWLARLKS